MPRLGPSTACCAVPRGSLTPERVAHIRSRVQETEDFQVAETAAKETLSNLARSARALEASASSLPHFIARNSRLRRKVGFRIERIRTLLGADASVVVDPWLTELRNLVRARVTIKAIASDLTTEMNGYVENPDTLHNPQPLKTSFGEAADAFQAYSDQMSLYSDAEDDLLEQLATVIDAASDTAGWRDLIDMANDQSALRASLIERNSRIALQEELKSALRMIDNGNEQVLNDKFSDLSDGIQRWWDLLRPDEPTFFSAVMPRKGARRTVDFKAGLSLDSDRISPQFRDVIAVFSQSQLHCLGLALFIARALHERAGFIVLDDPILSSDEDYRAYFQTAVLEELIGTDVQVIVLTQDQKMWKDLEQRYLHENIDMFQLNLTDRADGTAVTNTGDGLMAMLARAEVLARGGHAELPKRGGRTPA